MFKPKGSAEPLSEQPNCCKPHRPSLKLVFRPAARMSELAIRYPQFSKALLAINARVVDLLPIACERYYHPSQQGSWSIKKVLPAVVPELRYDALGSVQDSGMAMEAFLDAIHPDTHIECKNQIEQQLLAYCKLDTYAMVRLWQVFSGQTDLRL